MSKLLDKIKAWATGQLAHLKWGAAAAIALGAALLLARYTHPALSLAVGGPLFGWALERYQAVRREGVPSKQDMVATAAPFEALAAAWWFLA